MITTHFTDSKRVLIATPTGKLTTDDFTQLSKTFDDHVNETDDIPNLLFHISKLPHWDSFSALKTHFNLIKNRQHLIKKVAIVSDSSAVKILPYIVDHLLSAKVRRFPENKLEAAKAWTEVEDDHPGAFKLLDGFPSDVVAIKAKGIITSQDYQEMLVPLVEGKLKQHDRLKLFMVLDDEFSSWSEAAALDDMRFGFSHLGDFTKMAVITDLTWVRAGMIIFGPLMRAKIQIFDVKDIGEAQSWIKT